METPIVVAALYKFVYLPDFKELQVALLKECKKLGIKGTLLLAEEGINGTIAGTREAIDGILHYLRSDSRLNDLEHKESFAATMPFIRMKVKLKKEIVTLGVEGVDPTKTVGQYLNPQEWNKLLTDPEVLTIDTRNDYEVSIGKFKGAQEIIDPQTTNFREFPEYIKKNFDPQKHKKVAMYCTGGIRCEKASSYMLTLGFENVYHLKGGILKYLEEIPEEKSLWEGECFVFDERVAVTHGLKEGSYDQCHGCRHPITEEMKQSEYYVPGVSCPLCYNKRSGERKKRSAQRQLQIDLAKKRGTQHLGLDQKSKKLN
ncbi:MAG: hypothetical protein C5B43_03430 [Verrucomicrobia bacterium]|nr:MAG: hypothetical protein C5B43_03430 [Verrucomicrobiota bacterium]